MNALQQMLRIAGFPWGERAPAQALCHVQRPGEAPPLHADQVQALSRALAALQQENQRLEAESRAKTRLFAAAIHDLRQPLQALMLFSEALAQAPPSAQQQRHAHSIRHSVASLDRLCAGLLDLTQISTPPAASRMQPVALASVLADLAQSFGCVAQTRGLRLVVRSSTLHVQGDALMLTRILNNLVCNALAHTHRGGVLVGVRRARAGVRIDVCDTGAGMESSLIRRLAEPDDWASAPAAAPEAGLGLRTVQRLARWHGARIRVQSRPGRGTTVSMEGLREAPP